MVLQPFEQKNSEVIFSQMTNWVQLIFVRQVYISPMHLHTKNRETHIKDFQKNANWLQVIMAIFSKTIYWIQMKITRIVHLGYMQFLSKNHESPTYQLQDMSISISALLQMNMNQNVLQLNFLNQYFTKYKLGWAEILQESNYHYISSPHQKLEKPATHISRKMQIGYR